MSKNYIVSDCDKCKKEDSINCINGLCPSCELEALKEENDLIRENLEEEIGLEHIFLGQPQRYGVLAH